MKRMWVVLVPLIVWTVGASAEVRLEIHHEPLVQSFLDGRTVEPPVGGLVDPATKSNRPNEGQWVIPYFEADKIEPGDTTYFSVRNESGLPTVVQVQYSDVYFNIQRTDTLELAPRQMVPIALNSVPNLTLDADGYARGFIHVFPLRAVAVDVFHLDTRGNFATGGLGYVDDEWCTRWSARFLRFTAAGGTSLIMLINGPQGSGSGDPVSILGDVFTENGDFVNSFTIRTDQYAIELPMEAFGTGGVDFGYIELAINSRFLPAGLVELRHDALGRFSVGLPAVCTD
jgi:hypothetical protein